MNKLFVAAGVACALVSMNVNAEIAVIVNPTIGVETLSDEDVQRIFLGKTKSFPNQKPAVAIVHSEGGEVRSTFDKTVLGKSPNQMKAYWSQLIFTGRATPPSEFASQEEIRKLVADNPNMIGYISAELVDGSVKVVKSIK